MTRLSPTSDNWKPSTKSPCLMRIGPAACAIFPGEAGPAPPSCKIACRVLPMIAVPSNIIPRILWNALELASDSRLAPAPRSGSKRFLLMMISVLTVRSRLASGADFSTADGNLV
jgi:hypothetical protein